MAQSNPEMHDVLKAFHAVSDTGTRSYYACPVDPTTTGGLIRSHFKGIASFAGKLIFTHTNLAGEGAFGKYLIADRLDAGAQGTVDATYETQPEGWCHPCSAQACGSFMAMGIQQAEDSGTSVIQICDLQNTQDNQRMVDLGGFAVNGGILFTLNAADDGANNTMCLYSIDLAAGIPLSKLAHRFMTVPGVSQSLTDLLSHMLNNQTPLGNAIILLLWAVAEPFMNSSFRWGKGLAITSPDSVTVYASDRNVLPLSHATLTRQDFSLVAWS